MKSLAFVLSLSLIILLACVASERTTSDTPTVTRVDTATTATVTDTDTTTSEPSMLPITPEPLDWRSDTPGAFAIDAEVERHKAKASAKARPLSLATVQPASASASAPQSRSTRTVTLLGQTQAETRTVHLDAPALPTPVLDHRKRECIGYPLTGGFSRFRYNLMMQPNPYDVTKDNWSNPQWRETFRVDGGTFPVALWRKRTGQPDKFIEFVRVKSGPVPTESPQKGLSAADFRGGDVLCVEALRSGGPLFIAYDPKTGQVEYPRLSMVENASNDSTAIPGTWTTIRRFDYMVTLDSAPDESRLVSGDEIYHCPELEAPPPATGGQFQRMAESWIVWSPMIGGRKPTECELVKVIQ